MKKQKLVIFSTIGLILLFLVGGYIYKDQQFAKAAAEINSHSSSLVREYSPKKGNENAKVVLVEFFDPACGTCAQFHPFVDDIMQKNEGKIKLVMRYAPFHNGARAVVKILDAAKKQGRFWQTLDVVFKTQSLWKTGMTAHSEKLWKYLPQAGLDIDRLVKDLKDPKIDKHIDQDLADVKTLGVHQTPEFFVNGKPLKKFGYKELENLINSEL
jgi:protein-disulfide isomerase